MAQRFIFGAKAPYIRKSDSPLATTRTMMRDLLIALAPLIFFNWYKNGIIPFRDGYIGWLGMLYPLLFMAMGTFFSFAVEVLYYSILYPRDEVKRRVTHSFSLIPGLLLSMILAPLGTPVWVLFIGVVFGVVVGKLLFGGFGNNIFNPALVGYIFITIAFFGVIQKNGGFLNPAEASTLEAISGATPLTYIKGGDLTAGDAIKPYGTLFDLFLGVVPGSGAETSAMLIILAGIYLAIRKVIDWRIPVGYVSTVFVLMFFVGIAKFKTASLTYPLFHVLGGGLLFGAVFMATEPVTAPRNRQAKIMFAISLGVLTVVLRALSSMAEGVCVAILFMNALSLILDKMFAPTVLAEKRWDRVGPYVYVSAIWLILLLYLFLKVVGK